MKNLRYLIALAIMPLMFVTGCNTNAAAALISTVGVAIASLETIEGNTALASKLSTDFSTFSTQVKNFVPGSATSDLKQAATDVEADLNLLPVTSKDGGLIDLAISTVISIVNDFVPATTVTSAVRPSVSAVSAPKTSKEFKSKWNSIAAQSYPAAKIK
jgi:hypothetical protein